MGRARRQYSRPGAPPPADFQELRFTRYRRSNVPRDTYFAVLDRDQYVCQYCGADGGRVGMGVDHVIPVIIGGSNRPENLVACCVDCNTQKSDKVDSVRTFWRPEHYAEMIRILIRDRDEMQRAAVDMAREARERFGQQWKLHGVAEVLP